ncbi:hypothetical protein G6F46_000083 [Rhizopus delemar]|nr:hypothetical protein G6F55_006719 [Rhizopus delemar]KAG1546201.1 hypothetical protein G6F49_010569 [Rhizopus delemar]KAG1593434.1 hypothetical protein G6F48_001998 [Rhizopus delemar]KAG1623353.1 hypothetical protein G6F46_000083 [Rhizopus delemar]KAG1641866.1 hypothetical protein G6F44_005405 [Rhizopus delemar]
MRSRRQQDQQLLASLNRHPESLRILCLALKCKDVDELEDFDFGKVPVAANDQARCLLRSIRYTLQGFVSKCRRKAPIIPSSHERTVFLTGDEKIIMSRQSVTLLVVFSESSSPNYADGIGYSTTAGIVDEERIMVECSSGGREENVEHTYDDSLKLVKSLTAMLVLKAYKRSNANYKTFCKFKIIGIQCIKRMLTLFVLSMNEQKKLVLEEKRSANELVLEQEQVDKELRSEHTGITDVAQRALYMMPT